jgi:hypothetical protein
MHCEYFTGSPRCPSPGDWLTDELADGTLATAVPDGSPFPQAATSSASPASTAATGPARHRPGPRDAASADPAGDIGSAVHFGPADDIVSLFDIGRVVGIAAIVVCSCLGVPVCRTGAPPRQFYGSGGYTPATIIVTAA